jgi:hypothetical protein
MLMKSASGSAPSSDLPKLWITVSLPDGLML